MCVQLEGASNVCQHSHHRHAVLAEVRQWPFILTRASGSKVPIVGLAFLVEILSRVVEARLSAIMYLSRFAINLKGRNQYELIDNLLSCNGSLRD